MFSDTLLPLESNYAGTFRTLSDGGDSGNEIFKGLQGCSGRVGGFQRFFVFKVGLLAEILKRMTSWSNVGLNQIRSVVQDLINILNCEII